MVLEVSDDLPMSLAGLVSVVLIDLATLDKGISAGVAALTLAVPGALMIQAPHVMGDNPLALTLQISAASRIPSDEWNSGFLVQF